MSDLQQSITNSQQQIPSYYLRSVDSKGRGYGTGRGKKNAIAKVWAGYTSRANKITINDKTAPEYFSNARLPAELDQVLQDILGDQVYVELKISSSGGGETGQARAMKLGIARALVGLNISLYNTAKQLNYLTRDSRVAESKKYGQPKARKSYPYNRR